LLGNSEIIQINTIRDNFKSRAAQPERVLLLKLRPRRGLSFSVVDPNLNSDPDPIGSETFGRIRIQICKNAHFGSGSGQLRIRNEFETKLQAGKFTISQHNAPIKKYPFLKNNTPKKLEFIQTKSISYKRR
jgi:hypothetical protein